MNKQFKLINTDIELFDTGKTVDLYEQHHFEGGKKVVKYMTEDLDGNRRYFEATRDPELLRGEERHRVLDYCLAKFDEDEIVNYSDLFLHGEFVKEMNTEIKSLQEQLDYNLRHAKDLATFSDAYNIKRRAHCLDEAARLEKRIANLNTK